MSFPPKVVECTGRVDRRAPVHLCWCAFLFYKLSHGPLRLCQPPKERRRHDGTKARTAPVHDWKSPFNAEQPGTPRTRKAALDFGTSAKPLVNGTRSARAKYLEIISKETK